LELLLALKCVGCIAISRAQVAIKNRHGNTDCFSTQVERIDNSETPINHQFSTFGINITGEIIDSPCRPLLMKSHRTYAVQHVGDIGIHGYNYNAISSNCAGKWNIKYYGMECIVNYQRSEFRLVSRLGLHVSARVLWCGGGRGYTVWLDVTTITKTIKAFPPIVTIHS
jgi:hypothetical protein